jgi:hypothetical protein
MEIKRDSYLNKLISKEQNGLIKVVTGVRRYDSAPLSEAELADLQAAYGHRFLCGEFILSGEST